MEISRINSVQNQNFGATLTQNAKTFLFHKGEGHMLNGGKFEDIKDTVELLKNISPKGIIDVKEEHSIIEGKAEQPCKSFYLILDKKSPAQKVATIQEYYGDYKDFFKNLKCQLDSFEEDCNYPPSKRMHKKLFELLA